jgi:hypothetical protein
MKCKTLNVKLQPVYQINQSNYHFVQDPDKQFEKFLNKKYIVKKINKFSSQLIS